MITEKIKINYKGKNVELEVRHNTQDEPMARGEVFERNYYREYGKLEIKSGDTVFDLGANVGSFSILAGIEGARKIVAVEPHPETIALLEKNLETNGEFFAEPVTVFRGGIMGESKEEVPFYLCNDPYGSGSHTLTLNFDNNPLGFKSFTVKTISLDQLMENTQTDTIDFLKLDIEGAEYEVLKNCQKLDHIRQISMEWHHGPVLFADLLTFLKGKNFSVAWFEGDDQRGKLQMRQGGIS